MKKGQQIELVRGLLEAEPLVVVGRLVGELGVEGHLVGGAVRDALLGGEAHDFDVVVSGRGREVAEGVARRCGGRFVALGGKEFAAFRVVKVGEAGAEWELDVWDREGGSLRADLARRDFTVNAVAVRVGGGEGGEEGESPFVDPFGGLSDLAARRLRATTDQSFTGDPLRVLRLPRFLAQLDGFAADEATVALARQAAPGLGRVASERVRDELESIFRRERVAVGLAGLIEVAVYPSLWLGEPGAPVGETLLARARRAVGQVERLAARAAEVAELAPGAPEVDLPAARWAIAFAALGEGGEEDDAPPGADGSSMLHAAAEDIAAIPAGTGRTGSPSSTDARAVSSVERLRDAGQLTHARAAAVAKLLAEPRIPAEEIARRRFLHRLGTAWPTAAARLGAALPDHALGAWRESVGDLAALLAADGEHILDPPRLLTGEDVQRLLALPPGPAVGRALAQVRQAQVDGRIRTREEAEALLANAQP
jgi:poly(A) polymerase